MLSKSFRTGLPSVEEIASTNPAVDASLLAKLRRLQDGLPQAGNGYNIDLAFDSRTVVTRPSRRARPWG